jgi:hypothetical protein
VAAEKPDAVISFKITEVANERLEEIAGRLSDPSVSWRKPMSRHQAAKAIVLAVLGAPGHEPILEHLQLRKEEGK